MLELQETYDSLREDCDELNATIGNLVKKGKRLRVTLGTCLKRHEIPHFGHNLGNVGYFVP